MTLLAAAIIVLFITGDRKGQRQLDERVTLRRQDKIPYGTFVAFRNLEYIFPQASISVSRAEPGYWDSLSNYDSGQAIIMVTGTFSADKDEFRRLISFMENGNDVFISTRYISAAADAMIKCASSSYELSMYTIEDLDKNMSISLSDPPFGKRLKFSYPGRTFNSYFSGIDSSTTRVLGHDQSGRANFIHLRAGKGNLYVHMEPLAFSNYFLLHKENIGYYEKALSVIDPGVTKLVWDEYYLNKKQTNEPREKKKSWFSVLMGMKNEAGNKPFRAAFWLLILLLIVYVLMEMRRKQRSIPVIQKPKNDSLDFVSTIGRLYYDKGDHKNLCRKMTAYFLEHVRNKYKLSTGMLDENFIRNLQYKSGAPETAIREIVTFIKYSEDASLVRQEQLKNFHRQLESFYSKGE